MKNIKFKIYHPTLDLVSDRTLRSILKKFSTLLREIQYQEAFFLINHSNITKSEKQSLQDRLKGPLNHIDAYYIEHIEKGSIIIEAALTAIGLWLLKNTIGESIKEAWKQSDMHESIVSYLSEPLQREKVIDRNVDRVIDAWNMDGFLIETTTKEKVDEDTVVFTVNLKTDPLLETHIKDNLQRIDTELVIREIKSEIERLRSQQ
ncbi:hypothetical protein C9J69_18200 [Vibrio cholerae]|uniref:hypothetical protein n=1 Tax=Vibrio cholerae TaxID=666 RepID=UPI000D7BB31E|nr:hypothetical protein [Vibrio cholerae]PYC67448.1 hypothetical protein C9J63_18235 [Vibrio cholerae]PYC77970.1 hypothetical protein C9J67_18170 [Vibrio cholerae]PYC88631.1 hypothetical protein C9J69_18200 [Vibrio cholerae]PYC88873.1 hypothetical protein C9J72_18145 [Vibrio cholerae]